MCLQQIFRLKAGLEYPHLENEMQQLRVAIANSNGKLEKARASVQILSDDKASLERVLSFKSSMLQTVQHEKRQWDVTHQLHWDVSEIGGKLLYDTDVAIRKLSLLQTQVLHPLLAGRGGRVSCCSTPGSISDIHTKPRAQAMQGHVVRMLNRGSTKLRRWSLVKGSSCECRSIASI